MEVDAARVRKFREHGGVYCLICVYAYDNLRDAELPPACPGDRCALGCRLDDTVCTGMRTSNCSIKVFPA